MNRTTVLFAVALLLGAGATYTWMSPARADTPSAGFECAGFQVPENLYGKKDGSWSADVNYSVGTFGLTKGEVGTVVLPSGWTPVGGGAIGSAPVFGQVVACRPTAAH